MLSLFFHKSQATNVCFAILRLWGKLVYAATYLNTRSKGTSSVNYAEWAFIKMTYLVDIKKRMDQRTLRVHNAITQVGVLLHSEK